MKDFFTRSKSREANTIYRSAPGVLIISHGGENLIEQQLRFEMSRLARHVSRTIDAQVPAANDDCGQRLTRHAHQQSGIALSYQRQRGQSRAQNDSDVRVRTFDDFFVLPDYLLPGNRRHDLQIPVFSGLAHPGNYCLIHIERYAFLQSPSQKRQGIFRTARKSIKWQNEDTNNQIRNQKREAMLMAWNAANHFSKSGTNGVSLVHVYFNRRRKH